MQQGLEQPAQRSDVVAFACVTVFAAVMYAVPGEWIPGASVLRLALVSSALAAGLMLVQRLGHRERVSLDGARGWALVGFVGLAAASMGWSLHPEVSRSTALELVKLAAIYFTLVNVVSTPRRLAIACAAMVLASIVTSIGVINFYRVGENLSEGYRARWVGVYSDPNHMAMDVGIIVPLAVAFWARKGSKQFFRIACALAAGLAVTAIVLSHSRGGFIGLLLAMSIWAFREKRRMQALVAGAALLVGLLVFAPDSFWKRNETVATFHEDASAMGRVYAWEVASRISMDKPLLGVGAGAFRFAWPIYAPPEARRAYVAHNVFLDVIGELGFVGLFLFLIFAGGAAGGAFKACSDERVGWLARGLAASMAGYLVCDLFSGYILSAHLYVLFGLAASAHRIAEQRTEAIVLQREPGARGPVYVNA
jgi:putative inorganic carbon (hco3(-)) transporter